MAGINIRSAFSFQALDFTVQFRSVMASLKREELPKSKFASIGIDIGGTKIRLALFDEKFKILDDQKLKTPRTKEEFEEAVRTSVRKLLRTGKEDGHKVSAIGIGFAGSIDREKPEIKSAPNVAFLAGLSFAETLDDLWKGDIVLLNDAHAALYGELKLGKAAGYRDVIGIFIGTGIGGAVAIDGKLHRGVSGEAGNIGHYLLHAFGPLAGSERHGILDDFASRLAIAGTAATFAAKGWAPHLLESVGTDVRQIKSSAFAAAMRSGDKAIEELVRSRMQIVGIVLSNIVDFLSPEMIVLGGGLTDAMPELVCAEVMAGIQAHSTAAASHGLKVVTAEHAGHAVSIGAAKFAIDARKP
jgi:glucokinase